MVGVLSFLPLSRFDHGTTLVGATIGSPLQTITSAVYLCDANKSVCTSG